MSQTPQSTITKAHYQSEHEAFACFYPEHPPREQDPHYHLFNEARRRVIAAGIGCWICGTHEKLELHHSECEFAAATGIDVESLKLAHPEYGLTDDESFLCWVEGEGNLQVLCAECHRSPYRGIHHVPFPNWKLQKFWRKDLPPVLQPVNTIAVKDDSGDTLIVPTPPDTTTTVKVTT